MDIENIFKELQTHLAKAHDEYPIIEEIGVDAPIELQVAWLAFEHAAYHRRTDKNEQN